MPDTPPTLTVLTTYLLSQVGRSARATLAARLADRDARLWHFAVLAALADFGPHTQRDLAARLSIHPSDMAKVLEDLTTSGQVARDRDPADRRRVVVTPTRVGTKALAAHLADATAVQDAVLAPLTADERELLHRLLLRVHDGG
ncbi:MarR family winged helix-turn-helix transcriptional regulator [Actinosynnema sp. NPDC020468]|uniref:MarR family winged helix-turn-helix transcriptional regulator n=1 Tax=Actinosynnema sp. NPDC020468 TaxID=3154488 RepID=UPI0033D8FBD7